MQVSNGRNYTTLIHINLYADRNYSLLKLIAKEGGSASLKRDPHIIYIPLTLRYSGNYLRITA